MTEAISIMQLLAKLCPVINVNAISDVQVAIVCFRTAVYGAYFNVIINLENVKYNPFLQKEVFFKFQKFFNFKFKKQFFYFSLDSIGCN